jgi:hypothetical protein
MLKSNGKLAASDADGSRFSTKTKQFSFQKKFLKLPPRKKKTFCCPYFVAKYLPITFAWAASSFVETKTRACAMAAWYSGLVFDCGITGREIESRQSKGWLFLRCPVS